MTSEVEIARKIGAASKNKDWQFAAKHWDRVNDDQSKEQLLALARAAKHEKPKLKEFGQGIFRVGHWYQRGEQRILVCQCVYVSPAGRAMALQWYKPDSGDPTTLNIWDPRSAGKLSDPLIEIEEPDWHKT